MCFFKHICLCLRGLKCVGFLEKNIKIVILRKWNSTPNTPPHTQTHWNVCVFSLHLCHLFHAHSLDYTSRVKVDLDASQSTLFLNHLIQFCWTGALPRHCYFHAINSQSDALCTDHLFVPRYRSWQCAACASGTILNKQQKAGIFCLARNAIRRQQYTNREQCCTYWKVVGVKPCILSLPYKVFVLIFAEGKGYGQGGGNMWLFFHATPVGQVSSYMSQPALVLISQIVRESMLGPGSKASLGFASSGLSTHCITPINLLLYQTMKYKLQSHMHSLNAEE